jgi:hypothetical protein
MLMVFTTLFLGPPVWGWGSFGGFVDHPARVGARLVAFLATIALLFSGANMGGSGRTHARTTWILLPVMVLTLAMAWLPAYADRRDIATLDGD